MDSTQDGFVSIWLAPAVSEGDFAAYLHTAEDSESPTANRFAAEFGIAEYDHELMEACFESETVEVEKLLDGVSFGSSFLEAAAAIASDAGIEKANAAILLYDCAYQFDAESFEKPPTFTFLGAVPYDPEAE